MDFINHQRCTLTDAGLNLQFWGTVFIDMLHRGCLVKDAVICADEALEARQNAWKRICASEQVGGN